MDAKFGNYSEMYNLMYGKNPISSVLLLRYYCVIISLTSSLIILGMF